MLSMYIFLPPHISLHGMSYIHAFIKFTIIVSHCNIIITYLYTCSITISIQENRATSKSRLYSKLIQDRSHHGYYFCCGNHGHYPCNKYTLWFMSTEYILYCIHGITLHSMYWILYSTHAINIHYILYWRVHVIPLHYMYRMLCFIHVITSHYGYCTVTTW